MKEPAPSKAERISPLKNRPLAILKEVLDDADHGGGSESSYKHATYVLSPLNRLFNILVIDRVFRVERNESVDISPIECLQPGKDNSARFH